MRDSRFRPSDIVRLGPVEQQSRAEQAAAIGAALANREPSEEALHSANERMRGLPWQDFEAAIVRTLSGEIRAEWIEYILARLEIRLDNIDRMFVRTYGDVVAAINDEAEEWSIRRHIEPWALWSGHWPHVNLSNYSLLRLLPYLDLRTWLDALDGIGSPSWFEAVSSASEIKMDRPLLLRLVREADQAFDNWKPTGRVVPFVAAKWLIDHARELDSALAGAARQGDGDNAKNLQLFREQELPHYLDEAFETLLSRSDGVPLALHLSAHAQVSPRILDNIWRDLSKWGIDVHVGF